MVLSAAFVCNPLGTVEQTYGFRCRSRCFRSRFPGKPAVRVRLFLAWKAGFFQEIENSPATGSMEALSGPPENAMKYSRRLFRVVETFPFLPVSFCHSKAQKLAGALPSICFMDPPARRKTFLYSSLNSDRSERCGKLFSISKMEKQGFLPLLLGFFFYVG